jgi:hypothetical protein
MRSDEFLEKLKASRNSVFSFSELVKILNKEEAYCKTFLNRLRAKGLSCKTRKR